MKRKTITVCCSTTFYKQAFEVKEQLEKIGFEVVIPCTAYEMKKANNFDPTSYKTWYDEPKHYKKKQELIKKHFAEVQKGDAVLVLNYQKNGVSGYIGGNTLMEMGIAFYFKKPIYILNDPSENKLIEEEIKGLLPTVLNGDLTKLVTK